MNAPHARRNQQRGWCGHMKAVVLNAFGSTAQFEFEDRPDPSPAAGEVRIRVQAAAFNPVDYKYRRGRFGGNLPMILGMDAAGVVDAVGEHVTDLAVGDEVYAYLGGPKSNGAYAELLCAPSAFCARRPANLSPVQAAALPLVGLTAYQCVMDPAILREDKSAFVAGAAGGVGSIAIQLLRYRGADPIIATCGSERSATYLTDKLGIPEAHVLDYRDRSISELSALARGMNSGRRFAVAFDFWGGDMKRLCCDVLGFDGRAVSIVEEPPGFELNVWNASKSPLFARSASLHFAYVGSRALFGEAKDWKVYRSQLDELAMLVETGQIAPLECTDIGPLCAETVRKAHASLETGHVQGKLVMSVG